MWLLEELHNPEARDAAYEFDGAKSRSCCQFHEFLLGSLFPSWVLSHHQDVRSESTLGSSCCLRHNGQNCFHHNNLSIIRNSLVAILQELQAVFITPIMKYPLRILVQKNYDVNQSYHMRLLALHIRILLQSITRNIYL